MYLQNKKKFILGLLFGLALSGGLLGMLYVTSGHVFAVTVDQGVGTTLGLGTTDLKSTIIRIVQWALGLLGLVAVIIIMYGGFVWMTAAGNVDKVKKAKKIITQGVIGLVIILMAFAIVSFISRAITNATNGNEELCTTGDINGCYRCNTAQRWVRDNSIPGCSLNNSDTFRVRWVDPDVDAHDVPLCSIIQVNFNGNISAGSITGNAHVTVHGDTAELAGTWQVPPSSPTVLEFLPDADYQQNTQYDVVLDGGAGGITEDGASPRSFAGYSWSFTTGTTTLSTPPTVTAINPLDGAADICLNTPIQAIFSSRMRASSVNTNTVRYRDITAGADANLRSPFGYPTPQSFSTRPSVAMTAGHEYSVTVLSGTAGNNDPNNGVMDVCLNHLDGDANGTENSSPQDDYMPPANPVAPWNFFADTDTTNAQCTPEITSITPAFGEYTDVGTVRISGTNFGITGNVYFNRGIVDLNNCFNGSNFPSQPCIASWAPTGDQIDVRVPGGPINFGDVTPSNGATDGGVQVMLGSEPDEISNGEDFDVTSPQIQRLSGLNNQAHGGIGQFVSIIKRRDSDAGFGPTAGRVLFRNMNTGAEVLAEAPNCDTYWNNNSIIIKVPNLSAIATACANSNWATCGQTSQVAVQVERSDGTRSNLGQFVYTNEQAGPGLCEIAPTCGAAGTSATLSGESLGATQGSVHFVPADNVPVNAAITSWANQSIGITVPSLDNANGYEVNATNSIGTSNSVPFDVPCGGVPEVVQNSSCNVSVGLPSPSPRRTETNACQNATIAALFNKDMDDATLQNVTNYEFRRCNMGNTFNDADCTADTAFNAPTVQPFTIDGDTYDQVNIIPQASLASDTWYRVTIHNTVTTFNNVRLNADYVWHFKTKAGSGNCPVDRVSLNPSSLTSGYPVSINYIGSPFNDSVCEMLNPATLTWSWSSSNVAVADFSSTNNNLATVLTARDGSTVIRATTEGKTGQSNLRVVANYCQRDVDCTRDGCTGATCNVTEETCNPLLINMTPASGPSGTTTTINGCYLGNEQGEVQFGLIGNGQFLCQNAWRDKRIVVTAPTGVVDGTDYQVVAHTKGGLDSNSLTFHGTNMCGTVSVPSTGMPGLCPDALNPSRGRPNDVISVAANKGYNLLNGGNTNNTFVQFTGNAGNLNVNYDPAMGWTSTQINSIEVPVGTITGNVTVNVNNCPSNPVTFNVSCNSNSQCAADECCQAGACVDASLCSTGGTGQLCQIAENSSTPNDPPLPGYENPNCATGPISSVAGYDCISSTGDTSSQAPPPPQPPAYGTDCRVCCTPGQTYNGLRCQADQGACTGTSRGLYCGCTSDNQCGDPASGCGDGDPRCCQSRPTVISTQNSQCRNTAVSIVFSEGMRRASITDKTVFLVPEPRWDQLDVAPTETSAMAEYKGVLYAGRESGDYLFETSDGTDWARIERPNGSGFAGLTGVTAMQVYKDILFVNGSGMILSYDGSTTLYDSSYYPPGWDRSVVGPTGYSMAVFSEGGQEKLFVGAENGVVRRYTIASVPGHPNYLTTSPEESDLGSGTNIIALQEYDGALYAGTSGGANLYRTTDGKNWTAVNGAAGAVTALGVYNNKLYVAYVGVTARYVNTYDGSTWGTAHPFSTNPSSVTGMHVYRDRLYASFANGVIMAFDGTDWITDRASTGSAARALVDYKNYLYAGSAGATRILQTIIVPARVMVSGQTVTLRPQSPLEANTTYRVIVRGDRDGNDDQHPGVLSGLGISMTTFGGGAYSYAGSGNDSYSWTFMTGAEICKLNSVAIKVVKTTPAGTTIFDPPDLFTCAGKNNCADDVDPADGNQHYYSAEVYDQSGDMIFPVAEAYAWSEQDSASIIDVIDGSDASQKVGTANVKNGTATVSVSVTEGGVTKKASAAVRVNLCEHSWPDMYDTNNDGVPDDTFPFTDAATNFSTSYCRDPGDLPSLHPTSQVITRNGSPSIGDGTNEMIREFFFLRDGSDDAIGIRVMENESGVSPTQWYREQFGSSAPAPQSLTVDGYQAVRAGRTVYVAATNIVGNSLYYNIYLLSYNEGASSDTIEIYNRMLANWTFNTNLTDPSQKDALLRDMQRLNDLNDVYAKLLAYKQEHGHFPLLDGGTFINGMTTSKWPSWQEALGGAIGGNLPVDPVNAFAPIAEDGSGRCGASFNDKNTCWNEQTHSFEVPTDSHLYLYSVGANGDSANLYTKMEFNLTGLPNFVNYNGTPCGANCTGVFNHQFDVTGTAQDHEAPVLGSVTPGGGTINGTPNIVLNGVSDLPNPGFSGVDRVEFWIGGVRRYTDTDFNEGGGWNWSWNTRQYPDAPVTLVIWLYDKVGNRRSYSYDYTINNAGGTDTVPPFVQITTPIADSRVAGTVTITTVASDNIGLNQVRLEVLGTMAVQTCAAPNASPCVLQWNSQALPDPNGQYTIRATATDGSPASPDGISEIVVQLDNTDNNPPTLGPIVLTGNGACDDVGNASCASPGVAGGVCGAGVMCRPTGTVQISVTASDTETSVTRVIFQVDSVTRFVDTDGSNGWAWSNWNTAQYANESHHLTVLAYDRYANEALTSLDVVTFNSSSDRIAPTVEFVLPTPGEGDTVTSAFTVNVNALDNLGVMQLNFYFDFIYQQSVVQPGNPTGFDVSRAFLDTLRDGCHTFSVRAYDSAGNVSAEQTRQIGVDQNCIGGQGQGPRITNANITPRSSNGSPITITARVVDADGVSSVRASIQSPEDENEVDSVTLTCIDCNDQQDPNHRVGNYSGTWDPPDPPPDVLYFVDIMATDRLSQSSEEENI